MASTIIRASSCHVLGNRLIRYSLVTSTEAVTESALHALTWRASQEALYKGKTKTLARYAAPSE